MAMAGRWSVVASRAAGFEAGSVHLAIRVWQSYLAPAAWPRAAHCCVYIPPVLPVAGRCGLAIILILRGGSIHAPL